MLMFVPPSKNPVAAFIVPVTERFPVVPASVKVRRVLGEPSLSVIVKTPLLPAVATAIDGLLFVNSSGVALDNVTSPEALIVVADEIDPVFEIPPPLLFNPPDNDNPPEEIVWPAVNVFDWFW